MTFSRIMAIMRHVIERCGLRSLSPVSVSTKADGSPVTELDGLIERLVQDELLKTFGQNSVAVVTEEQEGSDVLSIREIAGCEVLVTIDGIDGTADFIRHAQGHHNSLWMAAVTAVYWRGPGSMFTPLLAFGYQPNEDRLFASTDGISQVIDGLCGQTRERILKCPNRGWPEPIGSIDFFAVRPECQWTVPQNLIGQLGHSAYNMASIALACSTDLNVAFQQPNFTTFHYKIWDYGLWPILHAAGFVTLHEGIRVIGTNPSWFGDADSPPGRILAPVLICHADNIRRITEAIRRQ
jgi:hypothetical protein